MEDEFSTSRRRPVHAATTSNWMDEEDTVHLVTDDSLQARPSTPDSETTDEESAGRSHLMKRDPAVSTRRSVGGHTHPPPPSNVKSTVAWRISRRLYCTDRVRKYTLAVTVLILGLILIIMIAVPMGIWDGMSRKTCSDLINEKEYAPFAFDTNEGGFSLCHDGQSLISGKIGIGRSYYQEPTIDTYIYSNHTTLVLSRHNVSEDYCVRVEWTGIASTDLPLMDCFDITSDVSWFGGYETFNQSWPINSDKRNMTPFLPRDFVSADASVDWFGPILHPVWYNSKGSVLYVDKDTPLHVSINGTQMCLQSLHYSLNCFPHSANSTLLKYTVCGFENITRAAMFFMNDSSAIDHPPSAPSSQLFLKPIWSTWAAFKTNISLQSIQEFVNNITNHNYPISQLEIDDKYSVHYGELSFDPVKFPNNSHSIKESLGGVNISAWVTPFVEPDAAGFSDMTLNGRFLPGKNSVDGNSLSLIHWWNGYAAVINFIDHSTRIWQAQRLANFVSQYSLSGLKFDAGGESYIPRCIFIKGLSHPGQYSRAYVEFVGQQKYSSMSEVRVGYFSQGQPLLFRILDFRSTWGTDHGLQSVIPTVLSLGLAGYPFIMPDMIGGNGYNGEEPDSELYVRWLQLNTFLPVMQFSYAPWRYNDSTITQHALEMMRLHEEITSNYTLPCFAEAISYSFPIVRPLWWIAPTDPVAINISDQFLVGNTLLVAPILTPAATDRTVYFPIDTTWKCLSSRCSTSDVFTGPLNKTFSVNLTDVLYFKSCC